MVRSLSPTTANKSPFDNIDRNPASTMMDTTSSVPSSMSTSATNRSMGSQLADNDKYIVSSGSNSDSASDQCGSDCDDENCHCDASWIELSGAPSIPENEKDVNATATSSSQSTSLTDKIDSILTSLSRIDRSTQIGASLDPELVDLEQQLIQLREDNVRLLSVLEATNDAMKKNLTYAQDLKSDLRSSRDEYEALKSSTNSTIASLRSENEVLQQKIAHLECEIKAKELAEPVNYHKFDVNNEITMQEMSSQIASRDIRINQLMEEVNGLRCQLEQAGLELARQQQQNHYQQSQQNQLIARADYQTALMSGDQHNNSPSLTSSGNYGDGDDFKSTVMKEMRDLKDMIDKLRGEKHSLEQRLTFGQQQSQPQSGSFSGRPQMGGTSYTANSNADNPEAGPGDGDSHHHHGKHRRHHRHHHHAAKSLRRLEKKLAKTSLPIIQSGYMFKGFQTFSNQPT